MLLQSSRHHLCNIAPWQRASAEGWLHLAPGRCPRLSCRAPKKRPPAERGHAGALRAAFRLHDHGAALTGQGGEAAQEGLRVSSDFSRLVLVQPLAQLVGFGGQEPTCTRQMLQKQACKPTAHPKSCARRFWAKTGTSAATTWDKARAFATAVLEGSSPCNINWGPCLLQKTERQCHIHLAGELAEVPTTRAIKFDDGGEM